MRARALAMVLCLAGCELVAGLDRFEPAGGAGQGAEAPGGGGAGGEGGAAEGCAQHLLIRELRTRGATSAADDFVEIYNPTPDPISLDEYRLSARSPNGGEEERFMGGGLIAAYGFLLIAGQTFDDPGSAVDVTLPLNRSFGDDVIVYLKRQGSVVDVLCLCAMTPCTSPAFADCGGVALPNPAPAGDEFSVERVEPCKDRDLASDFAAGPATPRGSADGIDPP